MSKKFKKICASNNCFLWRKILRESVFKIKSRVLAEEFESIETFPGFVQLPGEKWVSIHTKINNQDHVGKKIVK